MVHGLVAEFPRACSNVKSFMLLPRTHCNKEPYLPKRVLKKCRGTGISRRLLKCKMKVVILSYER